MAKDAKNDGDGAGRKKISFDYIKSPLHRVVFASGALGGPNPALDKVVMSLYSERLAIPSRETFQLTDEGRLDDTTKQRESRDAIIREVEVTAMLDVKTAQALHEWLGQQIKKIEELKHV